MTMTPILVGAACIYTVLFIATVYVTRAKRRRALGALAGGSVVALVGPGVEALAHYFGWWRYTSDDTPIGPPVMYAVIVPMFAMLALIGWRVTRRFGSRGQAVYLVVLAITGALRDYVSAGQLLQVIAFAPGMFVALTDAVIWAALTALAQAAMRLVAGPAENDPLAGSRGRPEKKAKSPI
jgi:hypothetical protein